MRTLGLHCERLWDLAASILLTAYSTFLQQKEHTRPRGLGTMLGVSSACTHPRCAKPDLLHTVTQLVHPWSPVVMELESDFYDPATFFSHRF
jgi:hypothetical protein